MDSPPTGRDFHAMDCVDYVIGTVQDGSFSRVADYFSRDRRGLQLISYYELKCYLVFLRSTPQPDSFYGGKDNLVGAIGWEEDGDTYIVFRKKVLAE